MTTTDISVKVYNHTDSVDSQLCHMFPSNPGYCVALVYCKRVSSVLSIIGCILTIFLIWLFKKYAEFAQRMIIHLSLGSLQLAISYIMGDFYIDSTIACIVQATWMQYSIWHILLWVCLIILNLLLNILWSKSLQRYETVMSIVGWLVPGFLAALPFIWNAYGPAGAWCWIKNEWAWRFGLWYIWDFISFIAIFICIVVVNFKLRNRFEADLTTMDAATFMRKQEMDRDIRTLRLYPIFYFLAIIFPLTNRLQNAILYATEEGYVFPLVLLHCMFGPLKGFANAVVFLMDERTRTLLNKRSFKEAWEKRFRRDVIREFPYGQQALANDFDIEMGESQDVRSVSNETDKVESVNSV